jgi:hypothetical protein
VHWWQQSVYYLKPAPRSKTVVKEIARYSDRYKRNTEEGGGGRGGRGGRGGGGGKGKGPATLWETIHVPEAKVSRDEEGGRA